MLLDCICGVVNKLGVWKALVTIMPTASRAHVAFERHELNGSTGGGAKPRPSSFTSAVVIMLTCVKTMPAVVSLSVACCVCCCDCNVVKPSGALSPSRMGSACSPEWAVDDVVFKMVVVRWGCPSSVSGPERATDDA